jgi:hypothetical protein
MSAGSDDRERKAAERLGRLVDAALSGGTPPALLDADERALLETATEIHGAVHARLPTVRRRALVDAAFAEIDGSAVTPAAAAPPAPAPAPLRSRAPRTAWSLCLLAACAAAILVLSLRPSPVETPTAAPTRTDRLLGPIAADRIEDARARLDVVYADRLAQHRQSLLARREP